MNKKHVNKKVVLLVESFGEYVRLTLKAKQGEWARNMFENLAWVCAGDDKTKDRGYESFMAKRKKLAGAINCFRAVNIGKTRRGLLVKDKYKPSPFYFLSVNQKNDIRNIADKSEYQTGEYQDLPKTWENYKPQAEKYFDKVQA